MANFNTHISVAFVASGVAGLVLYKASMLSASEFLLSTIVGTIGGLLPDIDLDHAIPAKIGFNVVSLLAAFAMVIYISPQLSLLELMLAWILTYIIMRFGVFNLVNRFTVHRGIIHSVPYMAIFALMLVYASFYGLKNGSVFSWFLGLFLFFGALVHLILDEMYSVNVFGLSVKKSFGTALKFFDRHHIGWYVGLYAVLILMLVFAPPYHIFWQTLTDPISWSMLKHNALPSDIYLPKF